MDECKDGGNGRVLQTKMKRVGELWKTGHVEESECEQRMREEGC